MADVRKLKRIVTRIVLSFVVFLVLGNALILGVHLWMQTTAVAQTSSAAPGDVINFQVIDGKLWRGGHPSIEGYKALAVRGVTTIVDLRAEAGLHRPTELLRRHGVELVRIPMRDGQVPTDEQVARFLRVVERSKGKVYVHCMAGVGRTGTMVAAYLLEMKDRSASDVLRHNLAVGPPSLEQIAFVAGDLDSPNPLLVGVSRVLDGPRRIWSYFN